MSSDVISGFTYCGWLARQISYFFFRLAISFRVALSTTPLLLYSNLSAIIPFALILLVFEIVAFQNLEFFCWTATIRVCRLSSNSHLSSFARHKGFHHRNNKISLWVKFFSPRCVECRQCLLLWQVCFNRHISDVRDRPERIIPCETTEDFQLFFFLAEDDISLAANIDLILHCWSSSLI